MSQIEDRLTSLGLVLPRPLTLPPGLTLPFPWVNVRGDRAYLSGHGPQNPDGSFAGPFGVVGEGVSVAEAKESARKTALAMIGSLKRELGDLDRVAGWGRVFGMVCCNPAFNEQPAVINGFSEVILDVFGPEIGRHARSAVGMASLPFDLPVEVEAEVLLRG